jgi:hypothetical protein
MKKLIRLVAVAVAGLTVCTAAAAAGKERTVVESFSGPFSFAIPCSEWGPYAFENLVEGTQRIRVTEVTDASGTLQQVVFHVGFRETDTNSVTGKRLTLTGAFHEVWDLAANTRTLSGKVIFGTDRGGTWVHDTGRITMALDTYELQFLAGPHEAFFAGGVDAVVCAALNGS